VENTPTTIRNNRGMLKKVEELFHRRLHYCIDNNGGHFEHTKYIESLFGANQLSGKNTIKNFKIFVVNMNYGLSHIINSYINPLTRCGCFSNHPHKVQLIHV
jgi:hypothetical protein